MKRVFICISLGALLFSCESKTDKKTAATDVKTDSTAKPAVEMPYTAKYPGPWTDNISDADLKTVLISYKDWETGNMTGLANAFGDTLDVMMNSGDHMTKPRADIMKIWSTYRDSLSSVHIDMIAWNKMADKKDGYVVTWYKEYDTYKGGKVDSADYHDVNQIKNGKIIAYEQYKRKLK
jgi:ketosteroid isomerase-like protein